MSVSTTAPATESHSKGSDRVSKFQTIGESRSRVWLQLRDGCLADLMPVELLAIIVDYVSMRVLLAASLQDGTLWLVDCGQEYGRLTTASSKQSTARQSSTAPDENLDNPQYHVLATTSRMHSRALGSLYDSRLVSCTTQSEVKIVDFVKHPTAVATARNSYTAEADMETEMRLVHTIHGGHPSLIQAVVLFSDNDIVTASSQICIHEGLSGRFELEKTLAGHKTAVSAIIVLPGRRLVSGSVYDRDNTIKIWECAKGPNQYSFRTIRGGECSVLTCINNEYGNSRDSKETLFASDWDGREGTIRVYNADATIDDLSTPVCELKGHRGYLYGMASVGPGRIVSVCEASARVWDVRRGICLNDTQCGSYDNRNYFIESMVSLPDERFVVAARSGRGCRISVFSVDGVPQWSTFLNKPAFFLAIVNT